MADFFSGGGANTGWVFVEEKTMSVGATTMDFSSTLNGDSDGAYMICIRTIGNAGGGANTGLRINGATWVVDREYILGNGAVITSAFQTGVSNCMDTSNAGDSSYCEVVIYPTQTGAIRFAKTMSYMNYPGTDQQFTAVSVITTPNTATNITSLGIYSTLAMQVGTKMTLFKRQVS